MVTNALKMVLRGALPAEDTFMLAFFVVSFY